MVENTRICAASVCSNPLPPTARSDRQFCSKKCVSAEHNRRNPDRARELKRQWYEEHRDAQCAANARRYATHSDEIRARRRAYYTANREQSVAYSSAYYYQNQAEALEQQRKRRLTGEAAAVVRARRKASPDGFRSKESRRRAREAQAPSVPFTAEALAQRLAYFGNACWMCRGPHEALEHVKPLSKGGPHMLANIRPSCRSCNSRKQDRWFGPSELHRFIKT